MELEFNERLVSLQVEVDDAIQALRVGAKLMESCGYVKTSYESAIIDRESKYPTGIPTQPIGVAIPHTDIEHVNQPAVAVLTLQRPVEFQMMGNPEESVPVRILFVLAITDHEAQIEMLVRLSEILQDSALLEQLLLITDVKEVVRVLAVGLTN